MLELIEHAMAQHGDWIISVIFLFQVYSLSLLLPQYDARQRAKLIARYPENDYPAIYRDDGVEDLARFKRIVWIQRGLACLAVLSFVIMMIDQVSINALADGLFICLIAQVCLLFGCRFWLIKRGCFVSSLPLPTKRQASLTPRRLEHFVSIKQLLTASLLFMLGLGVVIHLQLQDSAQDLSRLWGLIGLNVLVTFGLSVLIVNLLTGKSQNMPVDDLARHARIVAGIQQNVFFASSYSAFILLQICIQLYQVSHILSLLLTSVFVQLVLIRSWYNQVAPNYSQYRQQPEQR